MQREISVLDVWTSFYKGKNSNNVTFNGKDRSVSMRQKSRSDRLKVDVLNKHLGRVN